jgi:MFS family permease
LEQKLILGAISLDLFAVLLGGAVALLPVYAREILHTGPWGLGLLRTAPGVGAAIMAVLLAHWPLRGRAGPTLLWAVAGFGIFTILFGISHSLTLSLISLLLLGAGRHDQRDYPRYAHATGDAGRDARARDRRGHDFYWNVE